MLSVFNITQQDPLFPVWQLENAEMSGMAFYKCNEQLFWTINQGPLVPIFDSPLYTIISEPLLDFFEKHVPEQIYSYPVTIYDRPTNSNIEGYHRIYTHQGVSNDNLFDVDSTGSRIWIHNELGLIFISLGLLTALKESGIPGIVYFAGLSMIGG